MASNTETFLIGQIGIRFLLEGSDTNGTMAMFEFTVPVGARVPLPHSHTNFDETCYQLEGTLTYTIDGKAITANPGETVFIARGMVHGFNNHGTVTAKALATLTPAAIGADFFKEQAAIVNAGGPPDMEKMKAVFKKYNIVPAFPQG